MTNIPCRTTAACPSPSKRHRQAAGAARTAEQQIVGCRWIEGDVQTPDWRYCQNPRLAGRSYCAAHHGRSINPDGDGLFRAEQAECDRYLCDLPPSGEDSNDEARAALEDGMTAGASRCSNRRSSAEMDGDDMDGG